MTNRLTALAPAAALLVATIGACSSGSGADAAAASEREFETVRLTDLEQITVLDGTLGFPEGEPVVSRLKGTITAVAGGGAVVGEGGLLFAVDGQPVVLLLGAIPAYRALGPDVETRTVVAGRGGTVTAIAPEGAVVAPGGELLRIDDVPVVLLPGDLPMWRSLREGDTGRDVAQLESALVSLGFDPDGTVTVDEYWGAATTTMVLRWQEAAGADPDGRIAPGEIVFAPTAATVTRVSATVGASVGPSAVVATIETGAATPVAGDDVVQLQRALGRLGHQVPITGIVDEPTAGAILAWQADVGAEVDGVIDLGEVVFLPDPVRVTEALLTVGRPVNDGSAVLATTGSASVVLVDLPAADQSLLTVGQIVVVDMPDGTEASAVVTAISGIATRLQGGDVVFETTITLADGTAGTELDQAPVDVLVVTDTRTGVLAVPVTALLALAEGGYAVEVDTGGGQTRLVGVDPGLFADGWVEITTDGVAAGDRVVVP